MKKKYISQEEIENVANSVLAKASMPHTWTGDVVRTDIDTLIEFEYGLEIIWENIDHLAPNDVVFAAIDPVRKQMLFSLRNPRFCEK